MTRDGSILWFRDVNMADLSTVGGKNAVLSVKAIAPALAAIATTGKLQEMKTERGSVIRQHGGMS